MPPTTRYEHQTTTRRAPKTADDRVNYLLSDYDRVTKSLESAKRQLRLHKITYACSIAIVCLDCWFSFNVLNDAGGSSQMAIALTLLGVASISMVEPGFGHTQSRWIPLGIIAMLICTIPKPKMIKGSR